MFIWGWSTKSIGNTVTDIECSHCEYPNLVITVFQKFFDVFFMPTIPLTKDEVLFCPHCETQFQMEGYGIDLNTVPKVKTPLWGYSGLLLIALGIGALFALDRFGEPKNRDIPVESLMANDIVVLKDTYDEDFPYSLIKITKADNGKILYVSGKYAYSSPYQAGKAARKSRQDSFYEDNHEISLEELKKLEIKNIERSN